MSYDIDDITEVIRQHFVLSEHDPEQADRKLEQLVHNVEQMLSVQPRPAGWTACDECGAWVSTELMHPDGAG